MEQKQPHDDGRTVVIELKEHKKEKTEDDITLTHSSLYPVKPPSLLRNPLLIAGILIAVLVVAVFLLLSSIGEDEPEETNPPVTTESLGEDEPHTEPTLPHVTGLADATALGSDIHSSFALLCEADSLHAIASKRPLDKMYPASLTKIMTFIVAYENLPDLDRKLTLTKEIKNKYAEASRIGIDVGDILTVEQALYAMMLESDTDAVLMLAEAVSGNEKEFVKLMNEKATELGLENTQFANATGLHDAGHYTTAAEMATIFAHALENEFFHTVVTTKEYDTYLGYYKDGVYTTYHFLFINSTFDTRIDKYAKANRPNGVTIIGGKTGFTDEAAICQALLCTDKNGEEYIIITGKAKSTTKCVKDLIYITDNHIN